MLGHYLLVAWRSLLRNKLSSCIGILSLSLAIGCGLLVFLFVRFEWTHDSFHEKADRIYELRLGRGKDGPSWWVFPPNAALGPVLAERLPGVLCAVRLSTDALDEQWGEPPTGEWDQAAIDDGIEKERERQWLEFGRGTLGELRLYAVPGFFEVFSFRLLKGDPGQALRTSDGVVLTRRAARRYFGNTNPLGISIPVKYLERRAYDSARDRHAPVYATRHYTVVGVAEDPPLTSSIQFDLLFPFTAQPHEPPACGTIYLLLADQANARQLEPVLRDLVRPYLKPHERDAIAELQPLSEAYLDQRRESPVNLAFPFVLSGIGLLILAVACASYANLMTAQAVHRAREIGVRKAMGAMRWELVQQLWTETLLLSAIAWAGGIAIAEVLLPAFTVLVQRPLRLDVTSGPALLTGLGLTLVVSAVAGVGPAVALSRPRPAATLRGLPSTGRGGTANRALTVIQFGLSTVLVVATLAMRSQVEYMKTKDLGFDGDQVVRVALSQDEPDRALGLLRTGLSSHPEIAGATGASMAPGWGFAARDWVREGDKITTHTFRVDADFMATLGLELVSGRNLREDSAADRTQAVIINEALAQRLGWKDPVGRALTGWNRSQRPATEDSVQVAQLLVADPTVIGVVRDFHYFPVQARIEAVVLHLGRLSTDRWQDYRHALIRLQARDIPGGLAALKQTWRRIWPDRPLVYSFLSGGFASRYRSEERSTGIVGAACGLAVLIGLLGLYGMAAQAIGRRTKEIGIRKALGASVPRIVAMLTKEFTYLVLAANAIAWPIAWYAMHRWLQGFAYRIDLGPGTFLLGGALALTVAWLTVSWQAVRAATANPVDALRYE